LAQKPAGGEMMSRRARLSMVTSFKPLTFQDKQRLLMHMMAPVMGSLLTVKPFSEYLQEHAQLP
jgi:hypothetical protein